VYSLDNILFYENVHHVLSRHCDHRNRCKFLMITERPT